MTATADILDRYGDDARVCELQLRSFGGRSTFSGTIGTVRCHEDNVLLEAPARRAGEGSVLVVDGGGSLRVAVVGDMIATLARDSGWAGIVLNACVRDVGTLATIDLGIVALGSTPRPSGKTGAGEVDVPVTFGNVTFRPGSTLYADGDGVVVIDA